VCFLPKIAQKNHKTIEWQDRKKTTIIKKIRFFFWWISDFFDFLFRVVGVVSQKGKRESFFSSFDFLDFNLCPSFDFLISSSSFFLAVTLWFSLFFLFRFFVHGFYHNSSLFRITYCFFRHLRWFFTLIYIFFFVSKR